MAEFADFVLVAAGQSKRFHDSQNKLFYNLGGIPIFMHSVKKILQIEWINNIIVVASAENKDLFAKHLQDFGSINKNITLIEGGSERFDSVKRALQKLIDLNTISSHIFIHDAARPFFSLLLLEKLWQTSKKGCASAPILRINDLIRYHNLENKSFKKVESKNCFATQTPQVILRAWIEEYFLYQENFNKTMRDEISVVEYFQLPLEFVAGDLNNIKITYPEDVAWALNNIKLVT